MFQLSKEEFKSLISQFAILNKKGRGGTGKLPFIFTEEDVAMLSSVLNSEIFSLFKKIIDTGNKPRNPIGFKVPGKTK